MGSIPTSDTVVVMIEVFVIIILLVLIILLLAVVGGMLLMLYGSLTTRVPFVPVPHSIVEALKKTTPLTAGDVFYDLGSGDGRVIVAMAKAFPEARAVGIEKAPFPYLASRWRLARARASNAMILYRNFLKVPLSSATHVYLYLYPETVNVLSEKLAKELKPGARVVTCDFPFREQIPERSEIIQSGKKTYTLYFYNF